MYLARRERLRVDQPRRCPHSGREVQATRRDTGAIYGREQRFPRPRPRHTIGEHQPETIGRPRARQRASRHAFQVLEHGTPVHHEPGGRRVVEDHDERRRLVQRPGAPLRGEEGARRGEHDQHNHRRPQNQEQQVSQLQATGVLALRFAQIAERRKLGLRRHPALEQMQQGGDRRGGEPHERQRMQERHASSRSAMPNGMSVRMWWYAMPCRRHAVRHASISRRTVAR